LKNKTVSGEHLRVGSRDNSLLCSLAICIGTAPASSASSFCCSCSSACSVPAPTLVSTPRQAQQKLFQAGHRTVGLGNTCPRNCHLFALPEFHPSRSSAEVFRAGRRTVGLGNTCPRNCHLFALHPSRSSAEAFPGRSPNCWARKHLPSELPSLSFARVPPPCTSRAHGATCHFVEDRYAARTVVSPCTSPLRLTLALPTLLAVCV
jgi:hypothetical protein